MTAFHIGVEPHIITAVLIKVKVDYPSKDEEHEILKRMSYTSKDIKVKEIITTQDLLRARGVVDEVYLDEKIERYIVDIVDATRHPEAYQLPDLKGLIQFGASPRATISLTVAAKAYAFLQGRGYVTPQDIKSIGMDVLRHRVIVSYEAEAEEKTSEDVIKMIFDEIEVP